MRKFTGAAILFLMLLAGCATQPVPGEYSRISEEGVYVSMIEPEEISEVIDIQPEPPEPPESETESAMSAETNLNADYAETESTIETEEDPLLLMARQMSLEEKVGQLFVFSLLKRDGQYSPVTDFDDYTRKLMEDLHPGGVIMFAANIHSIEQIRNLNDGLQSQSRIPLFISVDEEGGLVSRIGNNPGLNATYFPPMSEVGKTGNPENARQTASIISRELNALGFNMNMAPVADVNTNPRNPIIGNRSFGDQPELVAEMVEAYLSGVEDTGVASVIKHFPGHGDTANDTHSGAVILPHNRERMDQIELVPFVRGIEAGVDAVLTGHIGCPELTGNNTPATLSYAILTGILREELGFKGLIITDAMEMSAITRYYSVEEASVLAVKAGNDIILVPQDPYRAYTAVLEAVQSGEISEERIDESLFRILMLKQKLGLLDGSAPSFNLATVGAQEHLAFRDSLIRP